MKSNKTEKQNSGLKVMQKNAKKAESMLKLLANANRLMILCHLVKGAKSVGELSEIVKLSQSALSQHLARMRELQIVSANKKGKQVYYSISNYEVEAILSTLYLIYCKD